ncbi:MAG: hypothetical protein JWQ04_2326 [Pedosphaera sp.]|nr:hypothetical protein [Pedosphaera sp.]
MNARRPFVLHLFAIGILMATHSLPAQNWMLTTAPNFNWKGIACSADGTKLVAVMGGQGATVGSIFISTNSGATWKITGAPTLRWECVTSSADGTKLAAGASGVNGTIYTSADSGTTWTNRSVPHVNWASIASSADGSKLIAAAGTFFSGPTGPVYTSADSGATWTSNNLPVAFWRAVATSADGGKLIAMPYGQGSTIRPIYTSADSGTTWATNILSGKSWSCAASSADGINLAVASDPGGIYTSTNSGQSWTLAAGVPTGYYQFLTCSSDGSTLMAVTDYNNASTGPGPVFTSTNSGLNWVSNNLSGVFWQSAAVSSDGRKLVVAGVNNVFSMNGGHIYVSPPEVLLSSALSNGLMVVSWPTTAAGFGLQQNTDLTGTNWVTLTNAPVITNGMNQIFLPTTNTNSFFRIKQ